MKLQNQNLREFIAEGLGTFVLVALGCAANANAKLSNVAGGMAGIAWGMALTAGIFVSGGISGGHINPAVTLGMASVGKLPWYKVPHYLISQFIGAFLGAVVVFLVYSNAIFTKFTGYLVVGENATADIFGTYPSPDSTNAIAFFEQVVACFFFLMLIHAITDRRNMNCPKGVVPIAIGITDLGLCLLTYSYNSGGPINPARDFSPRLLSSIVGYGSDTFTVGNCYFWVPLVACPLGGILGSIAYKYLIEKHHPTDLDTTAGTDPSSNEPVKFNYKINRIPSFRINKY